MHEDLLTLNFVGRIKLSFMKKSTIIREVSKTKSPHLLCYALIIGITCITLSSCSTQRAILLKHKSIKEWSAYQWEEVKRSSEGDLKEWTVYSRQLKGTNFLEYKIEGDVEASPKACVASFKQDIHNQADELTNKKYPTYEILEATSEHLLTYVIHKEPFPFKDTEMRIHYIFFKDTMGPSEGVKWIEAWDDDSAPTLSKKLSRVETFRGSWRFSPATNNSCVAVNSVQFDPKKMPLWLVNPMVIRFLIEGLENIRETAAP